MALHSGTFEHDRDENLQEFLKKRGMNVIGAKVMSKISPTITVTAADGLYKIKTKTPLKTFEWDFKIGEEVTLETPEGKKKFIFTLDGDKLVQTPAGEEAAADVQILREFTEGGMQMVLLHKESGEKAVRHFKRA